MLKRVEGFATLSDNEWIDRLTSIPPDEKAIDYFFNIKCAAFINYIAFTLLDNQRPESLIGTLYEFLSDNDWHVIRLFKQKNGASLYSYLARCAVNHFMALKKAKERHKTYHIDSPDIIKELDAITTVEEDKNSFVWQAFNQLNKRDRIILRCLVIDKKSTIEAADEIWPYVKTQNREWKSLPPVRVQNTIAMLKRRALLSLSIKLKEIIVLNS